MTPVICPHEEFESSVTVARLTDYDGGPVTGYAAEIRIRCKRCEMPFQFVGVPGGYSPAQPMTNFDATTLRAPIQPNSDPAEQVKSMLKT